MRLVAVELLTFFTQHMLYIKRRHTLDQFSRHAQFPQLRLERMGSRSIVHHDWTGRDDYCFWCCVACSSVIGFGEGCKPVCDDKRCRRSEEQSSLAVYFLRGLSAGLIEKKRCSPRLMPHIQVYVRLQPFCPELSVVRASCPSSSCEYLQQAIQRYTAP